MRLLRIILLLSLLYCTNTVKAQDIPWIKDKPLKWKDFAGTPDNGPHDATTHSYLRYTFYHHLQDTVHQLSFKVECLFSTQRSWVRPGHEGENLLKHEQLHFDITELFARKLMAAFNAATYTANYREEIQAIFQRINNDRRDMQTKYDTQSNHSHDKGLQAVWEQYVHNKLEQFPRNY
ncbi:DUF922 domain-containing protein [Mucilaginibacter corticis]|uniref:DUF922 domain-containing protein n=1 Tax=Mucilaginibacter corticis TaxID=2597670 RepID=A0A556MW23_9SPHI|nr:DUF922 domain-containing protein [Mucilaginibacter corticis]TSJ44134.1 DUF922 domain-containing protein [Mucilaginibacter corticis]